MNDILQNEKEVRRAISFLKKKDLKLHPEPTKNWDALKALHTVLKRTDKEDNVVDAGGLSSPSTVDWLERVGYENLYIVNPEVRALDSDSIVLVPKRLQNFHTDKSFKAVLALSVIEHIEDLDSFLSSVFNLLEKRGVFILSTDFWPEKIETTRNNWKIRDEKEILSLIEKIEDKDLNLIGEPELEAENRVVQWGGQEYTFLFLVFEKGGENH